jgi:hypothetical protein
MPFKMGSSWLFWAVMVRCAPRCPGPSRSRPRPVPRIPSPGHEQALGVVPPPDGLGPPGWSPDGTAARGSKNTRPSRPRQARKRASGAWAMGRSGKKNSGRPCPGGHGRKGEKKPHSPDTRPPVLFLEAVTPPRTVSIMRRRPRASASAAARGATVRRTLEFVAPHRVENWSRVCTRPGPGKSSANALTPWP